MRLPVALACLPDLHARVLERTVLPGTDWSVPKLRPEQVRELWGRLDENVALWRARSVAQRGRILASVVRRLRYQGPADWADLLGRSTGLSRAGLNAAWEATFAPWDARGIRELIEQEGIAALPPERLPQRIVHVLSGNALPPVFALVARGLLLGAAQWLRPASREPAFAACIARRLMEAGGMQMRTCAVTWWPRGDAIEAEVLRAADTITATGDDASVAALGARARELAPGARFVGYGARWSLALLSRAAQTEANAVGLGWDVALFDQQGCLSPSLVLAEEGPALEGWCAQLAARLAALESTLPRGAVSERARAGLRLWREHERLGVATGAVQRLWESAGTEWAVSLRRRPLFVPSPLDRHLAVVPFASRADIEAVVASHRDALQGVAADLDGWSEAEQHRTLEWLHPSRIALPGTLQLAPPAWPQDHLPPLRALLRA